MIGALHIVTDAHAERPAIEQALAAARGGAWAVQLRDKTASDEAMAATARALLDGLAPFGTRLIINDRIEVAIAVGAHGVHIGQDDGDPVQVRRRIGPAMLLGLSIEAPAQTHAMPPGTVDYVGAGPVFATASKADHAAPMGLDGLLLVARAVNVPVIAIGGLSLTDVPQLKAAGAHGMAVISAASRAADPQSAISAMARAWSTP